MLAGSRRAPLAVSMSIRTTVAQSSQASGASGWRLSRDASAVAAAVMATSTTTPLPPVVDIPGMARQMYVHRGNAAVANASGRSHRAAVAALDGPSARG